jgi:hypothetical protein
MLRDCVNETTTTQRPDAKRWIRRIAVAIVVVPSVLALTAYGWFRHHYPYGFSHCCDIQLGFALRDYASTHGGFLPSGEESPEASLSLLYGPWVNANLLRGKTVPEELVQARLDQGLRLTPETCGWHYVEGLREDDDGQIAVCWDKVGLDHNGGLLPPAITPCCSWEWGTRQFPPRSGPNSSSSNKR